MQPSHKTPIESLADAIGGLNHVYMQLEQIRKCTIEGSGPFLQRVAQDEFATYKHHFNNTITALNSLLYDLSPEIALNDPDVLLILQETLEDVRDRIIDEANATPTRDTGLRGFAATALPLAHEIESKMQRYLKDDDSATARELIGQLHAIPALAQELDAALERTIHAITHVPSRTIAAGEETQHTPVTRSGAGHAVT